MDLPNIVCERVHMSVPLLFSFMIHIGWPCSMAFEHHYQNKVLDLFVVLQMPMFSWEFDFEDQGFAFTHLFMPFQSPLCINWRLFESP